MEGRRKLDLKLEEELDEERKKYSHLQKIKINIPQDSKVNVKLYTEKKIKFQN